MLPPFGDPMVRFIDTQVRLELLFKFDGVIVVVVDGIKDVPAHLD
jgi:hypothetical protein